MTVHIMGAILNIMYLATLVLAIASAIAIIRDK